MNESPAHLSDVLASLDLDDHLLVHLDAALDTLRERIVAREPPGWASLDYLLDETPKLQVALAQLGGVHVVIDTEKSTSSQIVDRIRPARPDKLSQPPREAAAGSVYTTDLLNWDGSM